MIKKNHKIKLKLKKHIKLIEFRFSMWWWDFRIKRIGFKMVENS